MIGRAAFAVAALLALGHAGSATAQDGAVDPAVSAAVRQIADGDRVEGLRRLEALAEAGDLGAHNVLGELYSGIAGVEPDRPRSCRHFQTAKTAGASAAHNYGQCLWEGAYGRPQMTEARVWYGRAAEQGFLQAQCALGNMMIRGEGGPVDRDGGVALCRTAAEAGDPNAQADMGDHSGAVQDFAEARRWYGLAAAQNQRNAAFNLATLDWNGLGGPVDQAAAGRWMERAYAAGRKDAAWHAGRIYMQRAVPNAPAGPVDLSLLAAAKPWLEIASREDPNPRIRAGAAVALAQASGYEALGREQ